MKLSKFLNEADAVADEQPKEGLSIEETIKKCASDPIWFIETYCKIDADKPFKMFEYQKDFVNKVRTNKYLIVNKSRQMGVSQVAGAFCLWYALFKPKKELIVISLNRSEAEYFIDKRVWEVWDSLPKFLKKKAKVSSDMLVFDNGSKIEAMANTKKALRGRSPSVVVIDEVAFQGQAEAMITSAMPALQLGEHLILLSTPNGTTGPGEYFYKTWKKAESRQSDFYPFKINWYENPLYNPEAPKKVDWQKNKWAMSQFRNYTNEDSFKQEILGEFIEGDVSAMMAPQGTTQTTNLGPTPGAQPLYDPPKFLKDYWRDYLKNEAEEVEWPDVEDRRVHYEFKGTRAEWSRIQGHGCQEANMKLKDFLTESEDDDLYYTEGAKQDAMIKIAEEVNKLKWHGDVDDQAKSLLGKKWRIDGRLRGVMWPERRKVVVNDIASGKTSGVIDGYDWKLVIHNNTIVCAECDKEMDKELSKKHPDEDEWFCMDCYDGQLRCQGCGIQLTDETEEGDSGYCRYGCS